MNKSRSFGYFPTIQLSMVAEIMISWRDLYVSAAVYLKNKFDEQKIICEFIIKIEEKHDINTSHEINEINTQSIQKEITP